MSAAEALARLIALLGAERRAIVAQGECCSAIRADRGAGWEYWIAANAPLAAARARALAAAWDASATNANMAEWFAAKPAEALRFAASAGPDWEEILALPEAARAAAARDARAERERAAELPPPARPGRWPASLGRARSEAAVLADEALARLSALRRHADRLLEAPDLGADRAERERNLREGARALYLHAAAAAESARRIAAEMRELLAPWLPEPGAWTADNQPEPLSAEEAASLEGWRAVHARRMNEAADRREAGRAAAGETARGRGRPPKSSAATPRRRPGRPRKAESR